MPIVVTPIYAGVLALVFIVLSFRVILMRREARISLGDGGNTEMQRRTRVHGNFIEYVPIALLLILLLELQGQPHWLLHLLGAVLVAGRLAHAYGVSQTPQILPLRVAGMVATTATIIAAALANLAAVLI